MSNEFNFEKNWSDEASKMVDEGFDRLSKLAALPRIWRQTQRVKKGASPSEIVYEEDKLKVLRYKSDKPPKYKTPVIFVFALVNRPYILDLLPNESVVQQFVRAGFDTYLVDWGVPTHASRHLTLDTHINGYLLNAVEYVQELADSDNVNIMGYCMGGTMSAMFTALHPKKVRNLMLLAAGIDFSTKDGLLNMWTDPRYFDVDEFVDAYGNCPAEFLQASFTLLKPIQNLVQKPLMLLENLDDEEFIHEYFTMETWLNDNIPVPGEVYRAYVKYLYQQNLLVQNRMPVGHHIVNLKKITCPILNIMALKDHLVPCAQSEPFNDLVGSTDRKTIKFPVGHIGLAVSSRAHEKLWPEACDWLGERSAT
jgi:polyhydroxyalkanoate synthase